MNWFNGEVKEAVETAISQRKAFLVFVKGSNTDSEELESLWNEEQMIKSACPEESCVALKLDCDSEAGSQFASIYPILCVPSTYVINNQGLPEDIIPGRIPDEEYRQRVAAAVQKVVAMREAHPVTQDEDASANEMVGLGENQMQEGVLETPLELPLDSQQMLSEPTLEQPPSSEQSTSEQSTSDQGSHETHEQKVARAREKIRQKQAAKAEELKQQQKDVEQRRRQEGAEVILAKREQAEKQAKQLSDELKSQKAEVKAARQKVLDELARDKAEKAARYEREKLERSNEKQARVEKRAEENIAQKAAESNTARIQLRLPTGSTVMEVYQSDENFQAVINLARQHAGSENIRLTSTFPKREFTEADALKSLRELGLCPSAAIIVSPGRTAVATKAESSSGGLMAMIMLIFAPLTILLNWISSFFAASPTEGSTQVYQQPREQRVPPGNRTPAAAESVTRRNIRTLRRDEDDDDENNTWNGNSTQQM